MTKAASRPLSWNGAATRITAEDWTRINADARTRIADNTNRRTVKAAMINLPVQSNRPDLNCRTVPMTITGPFSHGTTLARRRPRFLGRAHQFRQWHRSLFHFQPQLPRNLFHRQLLLPQNVVKTTRRTLNFLLALVVDLGSNEVCKSMMLKYRSYFIELCNNKRVINYTCSVLKL